MSLRLHPRFRPPILPKHHTRILSYKPRLQLIESNGPASSNTSPPPTTSASTTSTSTSTNLPTTSSEASISKPLPIIIGRKPVANSWMKYKGTGEKSLFIGARVKKEEELGSEKETGTPGKEMITLKKDTSTPEKEAHTPEKDSSTTEKEAHTPNQETSTSREHKGSAGVDAKSVGWKRAGAKGRGAGYREGLPPIPAVPATAMSEVGPPGGVVSIDREGIMGRGGEGLRGGRGALLKPVSHGGDILVREGMEGLELNASPPGPGPERLQELPRLRIRQERYKKTSSGLESILIQMNNGSYARYRNLNGQIFTFPNGMELCCQKAQVDKYAPPSNFTIKFPLQDIPWSIPKEISSTEFSGPLTDYLSRLFIKAIEKYENLHGFTLSQTVLERSACLYHAHQFGELFATGKLSPHIEFRFNVTLPSFGRSVDGVGAATVLVHDIPAAVESLKATFNAQEAERHIKVYQDQEALRAQLEEKGLVAFIGNGSVLPRRSGTEDTPLISDKLIPFQSPPSLEVEIDTPHSGKIKGMGIPFGVTMLTGGGFHGKSTLLQAIQSGIYNHIPGDGRERVVTLPQAYKVRAEDGRSVNNVNISPLIASLPNGIETTKFSTENASGSTSMASSIIEAISAGSNLLLVDEDTSATNLLIRDRRMKALVEHDAITPLVEKISALRDEHKVSTIIVASGCGDYLDVADTVISMDAYIPQDLTTRAKQLAREFPSGISPKPGFEITPRYFTFPTPNISKTKLFGDTHIQFSASTTTTEGTIVYEEKLEVSTLEQIIERNQLYYISGIIKGLNQEGYKSLGRKTMREEIEEFCRKFRPWNLQIQGEWFRGDISACRPIEIYMAISRLRYGVLVGREKLLDDSMEGLSPSERSQI